MVRNLCPDKHGRAPGAEYTECADCFGKGSEEKRQLKRLAKRCCETPLNVYPAARPAWGSSDRGSG